MGYSPWGRKESDTTKQLTLSLFDAEDLAPSYLTHPWSSSLLFLDHGICVIFIFPQINNNHGLCFTLYVIAGFKYISLSATVSIL